MKLSKPQALDIWRGFPESAQWPPAEDVVQCVERPELIWPSARGESFAIFNVVEKRDVDEDELSNEIALSLGWVKL